MDSRLKRRTLKQSKKQLYTSLIAIVALIFITLNFGPYLLGSAGSFIDLVSGKSKVTSTIKSDAALQPPSLDPIPDATPSAFINISGRSFYPNTEVELFVNGSKYKTVEVSDSLDFKINDVSLKEGDNILKVLTIKDNKKSDFSDDFKISYIKGDPKLDIDFPQDHASFSKADQEINVRGKIDPDNTVKVNDFIAIVDSDGNFSYNYKLKEGDNKLTITAENSAGKTKTQELTVSYSP